MAATAVYVSVQRIPEGEMTGLGTDGQSFINIAATTSAFYLKGGKYNVDVIGSTFGSVTLQRQGPDGTTWLTAATAFAANGNAVADLPSGQYRIAVA